jgi:eukaryotic-like serine/threonine-protein kinase
VSRCPTCYRRLVPGRPCPADGATAPVVAAAAAAAESPEVAGFTTRSLLGAGGFGSVWEAAGPDGAPVAIKVSHATGADARLRIEREASILARVGAPHVPALHGSGQLVDGRSYVVMERLMGGTLADEIAGWPGPLSPDRMKAIGGAVLASAAALHARQVIHGDLKPENVFLVPGADDQPRATLMDFGFGGEEGGPDREESVTAPGGGTPEYMAPEQVTGEPVGAPADVYALGLLLYELGTLRLPFVGDRRLLEYAHLSLRPPPPSDFAEVPAPLQAVILRCLAKRPQDRFADAVVLLAAFDQACAAPPEVARAAPLPARAGAAAPPQGTSERQKMVLLFAQGPRVAGPAIQAALRPFAAQLANVQDDRAVYAFGHRAGHSPAERALAAARAVVTAGLVERVIVDVADLSVKQRAGGARLFGPVLNDPSRYPAAGDRPGILLAPGANALFPSDPGQPAAGRPGYLSLSEAPGDRAVSSATDRETPPPLVGRADLLRTLLQEAARAIGEQRPRVARVLADPGLGGTRLGRELASRLRAQVPGAEVIELQAREPQGNDTNDTLAWLLRRGLELPAAPPADGGHALLEDRLGAVAGESYPSVALKLGWIGPDHPAVGAVRAAPGALAANLARAGVQGLRRLAARGPVVVVLDDAHFADDTLLETLEQATTLELPLWVCAVGRPAFAEGRPGWGQRAAHLHLETLLPLSPESAAELCRYLLRPAASVPEPVVARLTDRAQGVPLLLYDLVRGLRREGLVRETVAGACYVATEVLDRLPDSPLVEWVAGRELDRLSPDLAAHARLMAILSPDFTVEEIDGVLGEMERDLAGGFPLDTGVAVRRLRQLGLLIEPRPGSLSFRNRMLRDGVARRMSEVVATNVHRAALRYYRGAALAETIRTARLAWHAARAGERSQAAAAYLTLAESARERHNFLEADLLYTQALAHLSEQEEASRLSALKGRGAMRYRLGRYEGARWDLASARELAARGGDPITLADVMLDEAMALDWLFEWRRSRELAESARDLLSGQEAPALKARVLLALGRSLHRFNEDKEAVELLREAFRLAEAVGDPGYEVQVTTGLMLGLLLPFLGLLDEAEARFERIGRLCESKGDELHLAGVWINRGCLWIARNDRARFMEDTERVLAYARRMGSTNLESFASFNGACFFHWRGEYAVAEPFIRRRIEIEERLEGAGGFRPESKVLLARILWSKGEEAAAAALVTEVQAHQSAARARSRPELLLLPNDGMLLDMMDLAVTGAGNDRWQPLVERARGLAQGQELIEVLEMAGVVARRRGDTAEAHGFWQAALAAGELIPNVMVERIRSRLAQP